MKASTSIYAGLISLIGLIGPAVAPKLQALVSGHPVIAMVIAAVTALLSLFHNPSTAAA